MYGLGQLFQCTSGMKQGFVQVSREIFFNWLHFKSYSNVPWCRKLQARHVLMYLHRVLKCSWLYPICPNEQAIVAELKHQREFLQLFWRIVSFFFLVHNFKWHKISILELYDLWSISWGLNSFVLFGKPTLIWLVCLCLPLEIRIYSKRLWPPFLQLSTKHVLRILDEK